MNRRRIIEALAVVATFASTVTFYLVWWIAYVNGGRAVVAINVVGEAWLEYLLWILVTAVIAVGLTEWVHRDP